MTTTTQQAAPAAAPVRTVPTPYQLLQSMKAIAPEFAAAAEEKGRFKTLPPRKLMADLVMPPPDAPDELIRNRFLCRGGSFMLAAHTGKGKSSLTRQIAVCWAAGLPIFGLQPVRPMRQLIIQAENDEGDEAAFRDGVARCPYQPPAPAGAPPPPPSDNDAEDMPGPLPADVFARASRQIMVARCVDQFGAGFLETLRALLEADGPFDLVWIDPLLAFVGGDVSDQKIMSPFLRNGLAPLMLRFNLAIGLIHHTPKPIRQTGRDQRGTDMGAYLGLGSSELANWPRAVLALESTNHRGVFRFRVPKRFGRLGWRDPATGDVTDSRYLAHATDGSIYWREPNPDELREATEDQGPTGGGAGGRSKAKATAQDVVDILVLARGEMPYSELREHIMAATGSGQTAATLAIQKAVAEGLLRKRGVCPAFYKLTGKAKPSAYSPITASKQGVFNA